MNIQTRKGSQRILMNTVQIHLYIYLHKIHILPMELFFPRIMWITEFHKSVRCIFLQFIYNTYHNGKLFVENVLSINLCTIQWKIIFHKIYGNQDSIE